MQQNKISILSTRPLQAGLINKASEKNFDIQTISFIETKAIEEDSLKQRILHLSHHQLTVVFTSMNAVDAVSSFLSGKKPDWKIFCIGSTTKKLVTENFGEHSIAGNADSASNLADVIINQKNISSVIFFCGDKRRDELPEKLAQHNIEVNTIEVYKTLETPHTINRNYDAILFYSPSAVSSFFSVNKINERPVLFAIGSTTATEIKKYANNKIIISKESEKELLAKEAINYFERNPIHY
ncbi:MAG TPA: uroporphyrinogen-III synthase [Puia sp.]|jgi:uroporphyrinogen-III synthase|nr:uroporphyrinogen-III synthase [Puia sp.]